MRRRIRLGGLGHRYLSGSGEMAETLEAVAAKLAAMPDGERAQIGRPDGCPARGDAVVMAFTRGQDNAGWQATDPNLERPRVNRGHAAQRPR